MQEQIRKRFEESRAVSRLAEEHLAGRLGEAAEMIVAAYAAGGGVFLFGNGGSAADAQHIACELVGRFMLDRRALKAVALTTDTSILTAVANDFDYETVFVRQLQAVAAAGDVAIGLTTSGNSPNVVAALREARKIGMKTVAFTGAGGGKCAALADVLLDVPTDQTPRVQESHVILYHILCELVEQAIVDPG